MIKPLLQHDALLADIAAAQRDSSRPHLWWLGQSGFLVQWRGRHALIDPYLSDSLTVKYATTDKPHTRMTELAIDPSRLNFIDVVSSSHNHTDHLDADTLVPLLRVNPAMRMIVPEANRAFAAARLKIDPATLIGLNEGAAATVGRFTFHGVPAAHNEIDRDEHGQHRYMGYVIELRDDAEPGPGSPRPGGPVPVRFTIYHSGDTRLFDGMAAGLRRFKIDLALLPINGFLPERKVAGNLWGREAAQLAKEIGAGLVVPCHYDMFTFNTVTPEEFVESCRKLGQAHRVLQCGERMSL